MFGRFRCVAIFDFNFSPSDFFGVLLQPLAETKCLLQTTTPRLRGSTLFFFFHIPWSPILHAIHARSRPYMRLEEVR